MAQNGLNLHINLFEHNQTKKCITKEKAKTDSDYSSVGKLLLNMRLDQNDKTRTADGPMPPLIQRQGSEAPSTDPPNLTYQIYIYIYICNTYSIPIIQYNTV